MTVSATITPTSQVIVAPVTNNNQCDRVPAPSQTSDRFFRSRVLSRGSRKHSRLGTALANKMASASTVVCWPNTKDDYDLKEVIGEYHPHT